MSTLDTDDVRRQENFGLPYDFSLLTEDDEWSDDPETRRLCKLRSVADIIDSRLQTARKELASFIPRCEEMLRGKRTESNVTTLAGTIRNYFQNEEDEERAATLIEGMQNILEERGFRSGGALLSHREHDQLRSTVWMKYGEVAPDIPVGVVNAMLEARGEDHSPTSAFLEIAEADRARRLRGFTKLDLKTGQVTDEKDEEAAEDPYYFVPLDERAALIARETEILAELGGLVQNARKGIRQHDEFIKALDLYSQGKVNSPEIREQLTAYNRIADRRLPIKDRILKLKQASFESGSRDSILTPQEILIRNGGKVDEKYLARPYCPLALQDGTMTKEEAENFRRGEASMQVISGIVKYPQDFCFRLEELDDDGNTIKSPTFLKPNSDENGESTESSDFTGYFVSLLNVPYSRPGDWFYREEA